MSDNETSTPTLISALRILAAEIESADGVANMTIAEGADRIEALVAELDRVTAERDSGAGKCTPEHTWKQWADEHITESAVLRAHVAEHEATIAELTTDGNAATLAANLAKASERNAELVAVLRNAHGETCLCKCCEDARAESATPSVETLLAKTPPITPEMLDRLTKAADEADRESATPAKNAADTPENREACWKIVAAWAAEEDTPAKHPDTERLDWLLSSNRTGVSIDSCWIGDRDAIDAARNQEGGSND